MNEHKENKIVTVLGRKGTGKSFFVKNQLLSKFRRKIILDSQDEYNTGVKIYNVKDTIKYLELNYEKPDFNIIFKMSEFREYFEDIEKLFKAVWLVGDLTIVVEEANIFCNPYFISPALNILLLRGRHKNINQLYISQRPANVHKNLLGQSDVLFLFQNPLFNDWKIFKQLGGNDFADSIRDLPLYEYKIFSADDKVKNSLDIEG